MRVLNKGRPEWLGALCAVAERACGGAEAEAEGDVEAEANAGAAVLAAARVTGGMSKMCALCSLQQLAFSLETHPALAATWALACLVRLVPVAAREEVAGDGDEPDEEDRALRRVISDVLAVPPVTYHPSDEERAAVDANLLSVVQYVAQHADNALRRVSERLVDAATPHQLLRDALVRTALLPLVRVTTRAIDAIDKTD